MREWDYIIIGGGTAGLALASRLSENPNSTVLVLESGSSTPPASVDIPGLIGSEMGKDIDWKYSALSPCSAFSTMPWPRGKILGGSSALHFLCWSKASRHEYDAWEKLGNEGWNWESMSLCMRKAETYQPIDRSESSLLTHPISDYGSDGPIKVSFSDHVSQLAKSWIPALTSLGLEVNSSPLGGNNLGASTHAASVDSLDQTRSYSTSYLQGTEGRTNFKIMTECTVNRVILSREKDEDGNLKVESVEYRNQAQGSTVVKARREIMLCAGTIETPAILERSGIGNPSILKGTGIECLVDQPGVGENLQDHITISIVNELKAGTRTIDSLRGDPAFLQDQQNLRDSKGKSMLSASVPTMSYLKLKEFLEPNEISRLIDMAKDHLHQVEKDSDGLPNPSLKSLKHQISYLEEFPDQVSHMEVIGLDFYRSIIGKPEPDKNYLTFVASPQHLLQRGNIHIEDSNPSSKPRISPNYFKDNGYDLEISVAGTQFLRRLAEAEYFKSYIVKEVSPGPLDDEGLKRFVLESFKTEYHPVGTSSMLPREDGGVVDSNLRVYGTSNLRVCDASIIPLHVASHPQATVYGIAERLAGMMKR